MPSSIHWKSKQLEEGAGFEPAAVSPAPVFKTGALIRSATLPLVPREGVEPPRLKDGGF